MIIAQYTTLGKDAVYNFFAEFYFDNYGRGTIQVCVVKTYFNGRREKRIIEDVANRQEALELINKLVEEYGRG